MLSPTLHVAQKALIVHEGKLLVLMEADTDENVCAGKRCFPGGKIEDNETLDEGFQREIMEETGIKVIKQKLLGVTEFRPNPMNKKMHIVALLRYCTTETTDITLSTEHSKHMRVPLDSYLDLERPGDEDIGYHALVDHLRKEPS